jgi:hypothetical protein
MPEPRERCVTPDQKAAVVRRWPALLLAAWPWLLALLVLMPVLAPGFVLSYDMVFVPDLALRSDFLGTSSALPRALPSDAVVAVLDELVPGEVLQKAVLLLAVGLGGVGIRRLVTGLPVGAQLTGVSLYIWNPYVAERLVLGHWTLLLAHAALPWVVDGVRRWVRHDAGWAPLVLWLALGALSPSGGVMTTGAAVLTALACSPRGTRRRHTPLVLLAGLAVNAPWVVAGLLRAGNAVSDSAGAALFSARAEGVLPLPFTLLGLGGVWNAEVVPVTREGWLAVLALLVSSGLALAGVRSLVAVDRRLAVALGGSALMGLGLALAGSWGEDAVGWLVSEVPGAGLLRDGSRFLALLALPIAVSAAHGARVVTAYVRGRVATAAVTVSCVLAPLALLPDMAWGVNGRLVPVDYPSDYAAARSAIEDRLQEAGTGVDVGDVLVLPFTSYRQPPWNGSRKVLDPLGRYLPLDYVANDELTVSGRRIAGEDPRAAELADLLDSAPRDVLPDRLAEAGVQFVVLDRTAPGGSRTTPPGRPVIETPGVVVTELPAVRVVSPTTGERVLLALGWACGLGVVLVALVVTGMGVVRRVASRRRRSPVRHPR